MVLFRSPNTVKVNNLEALYAGSSAFLTVISNSYAVSFAVVSGRYPVIQPDSLSITLVTPSGNTNGNINTPWSYLLSSKPTVPCSVCPPIVTPTLTIAVGIAPVPVPFIYASPPTVVQFNLKTLSSVYTAPMSVLHITSDG